MNSSAPIITNPSRRTQAANPTFLLVPSIARLVRKPGFRVLECSYCKMTTHLDGDKAFLQKNTAVVMFNVPAALILQPCEQDCDYLIVFARMDDCWHALIHAGKDISERTLKLLKKNRSSIRFKINGRLVHVSDPTKADFEVLDQA